MYGGAVAVRHGAAKCLTTLVVVLRACYGLAGAGQCGARRRPACLSVSNLPPEPHLNPCWPGCVRAAGGATAAVLKAPACLVARKRCLGQPTALLYTIRMGVWHVLSAYLARLCAAASMWTLAAGRDSSHTAGEDLARTNDGPDGSGASRDPLPVMVRTYYVRLCMVGQCAYESASCQLCCVVHV